MHRMTIKTDGVHNKFCYRNLKSELNSLKNKNHISKPIVIPASEMGLPLHDNEIVVMFNPINKNAIDDITKLVEKNYGTVLLKNERTLTKTEINYYYSKAVMLLLGQVTPDDLTTLELGRISEMLNYGKYALTEDFNQ